MSIMATSGSGACELDRLDPVPRLAADLVPRALEHRAQVEPDDRLVLGDQDPHTPSLGVERQHPLRGTSQVNTSARIRPATTAGSAWTAASSSSIPVRMTLRPRRSGRAG